MRATAGSETPAGPRNSRTPHSHIVPGDSRSCRHGFPQHAVSLLCVFVDDFETKVSCKRQCPSWRQQVMQAGLAAVSAASGSRPALTAAWAQLGSYMTAANSFRVAHELASYVLWASNRWHAC